MTIVEAEPEAPPTDDEPEPSHLTGSIVRGIALVVLIVVVVPAVIATGDRLAVPATSLALLAVIMVVIAAMTYWLATVGAPAPWLAKHLRLTPDRFLIGVGAITAVLGALALAWFHAKLNAQHSPLGQLDLRAAATAARLDGARDLMSDLNRYSQKAMLVLPLMLVFAAVVTFAWRSAALMTATVGSTIFFLGFLKTVNPPPPLSALAPAEFSNTQWPSGHAAVQAAVAIGVVLWWWGAGLPRPSIVAAVVAPITALVGYARAFLGIHWLSEVFSGWLLAAVCASLVVVADRLIVPRIGLQPPKRRWLVVVAFLVAVLVAGLAMKSVHRYGFSWGDRGPRRSAPSNQPPFDPTTFRFGGAVYKAEPVPLASDDPDAMLALLPQFSETLLGGHVQPVGVVVIASSDQLLSALGAAGWDDAEVFSSKHLLPAITGSNDGNPVAPTFFDTRTPDLVIRRPASEKGAMHEAQVWQLPLITPSGCSTWAVTTSLDKGTKVAWPALFPERRTGSAIDTERDALADELVDAGFDDLGRFDFAGPMHSSAPGGSYVTDGKVAVVSQPNCTEQ